MNFEQVNVRYRHKGKLVPVGELRFENRLITFRYDPSFLLLGLELSPFKLPLKSERFTCEEPLFDGLFGLFNDSLPDGFGRLLLDRKLASRGIHPQSLTPLDRLCCVGHHGMGALLYEPEAFHFEAAAERRLEELDMLAQECLQVQEDGGAEFVEDLLEMNGSSAGARPKILVKLKKNGLFTRSSADMTAEDWIIKFRSSHDLLDAGAVEYAYHLMARDAGLNVPEARLFPSKKGAGHFGVKRFDRVNGIFLHMHTLSGLLHADFRIPSLDYQAVLQATHELTKSRTELLVQFRAAVFNVLAHNRDDHAKNFSFLMDGSGRWSVSPAYDLIFSFGPSREHSTTVMGEGKNPGRAHLVKLATALFIGKNEATAIIDQVSAAVSRFDHFAKEAGVSISTTSIIKSALVRID